MNAQLFPKSCVLAVVFCIGAATGFADKPKVKTDSWITFLSNRNGNSLVYRMRPDGSELKVIFGGELRDAPTIVEGVILHRQPHWTRQSPDRRFFLSWAQDTGIPTSKFHGWSRFMIYLGSTETGRARVIAPDGEELFAWSPDSRRFAYAIMRGGKYTDGRLGSQLRHSTVVVSGIDGSNVCPLLQRPGIWHVQDWSPDGRKLLLSFRTLNSLHLGATELFEFDIARAEAFLMKKGGLGWSEDLGVPYTESYLKQFETNPPIRRLSSVRYSPDGKLVAATEWFPPKGDQVRLQRRLLVIEVDTGKHREVAQFKESLRGPICWSPDGSEILFSRYLPLNDKRERFNPAKNRDIGSGLAIWSVGVDGKNARFVTTGWSPDWR